jgi:seryl-tRNA synthetase
MIDLKNLRANPKAYKDSAQKRGIKVDIDQVLKLDEERLKLLQKVEGLRSALKVEGKPSGEQLKKLLESKSQLASLENKLKKAELDLDGLAYKIPNLISEDTPYGPDESGNKVVRKVGDIRKFEFEARTHWDIGEQLGLIDSERAAKVSGSRFMYLKGGLVKLQFALISWILDTLMDENTLAQIIDKAKLKVPATAFVPVLPPVMVRGDVLRKMARDEPRDERYYMSEDDLFLVGSAEHTLGPMHMGEILEANALPLRYVGYSTSFRREAGTYGKDTRGIIRLHQFDKLEMESFCHPDKSVDEQNFFVAIQEYIVSELELPYQVVAICTGDMGKPDYRQIDIETWMPGQKQYRETHTSDLMTDYQSRALRIRFRDKELSVQPVHMNDATALAGRTLAAILENHQQADGSVKLPKVLHNYYGGATL